MKIAPFLLCAQISCALVAALDGILSEGVKVSELFDRSELAAENGYQVGHGQKGLPKRLWRREDQESQVEKRSVETEQEDAPTEGAKDKWTSFSEGLNTRERWVEVEKRSGGVFKRSDQSADSVTIGGVNITEEHLLGFILGKDKLKENECNNQLKTYCGNLKKVDGNFENVHKMIKDICDDSNNKKQKCKDLEQKIPKKVQELKTALEKLNFNDLSQLKDKDCTDNEPACFFLERADPTQLKEKCSQLRNACYQMRRNDVAVEVLLRAMKGDLKQDNYNNCEKKLKEVCYELSQESDELMQKCLDPSKTCKTLQTEARSKCVTLKGIDKILENKDKLESQCHHLLEQCYFYGPNCEDKDKLKCSELKEECEKKKVIYKPPGHPLSPIEYPASLLERIGLDDLYAKSAAEGVVIGRPGILDEDAFLMLVSTENELKNQNGQGCKDKLKQNCENYKSFPGKIKDLCGNGGKAGEGKCQTLSQSLSNKCKNFKGLLSSVGVSDKSDNEQSKLYGWHELSGAYLREGDCTRLQLQCLYFEKHCKDNKLGNACSNLRRACYKNGLDDAAYVALEKRLRGGLSFTNAHGHSAPGDNEKQQKLLKHCQELRNQSVELFKLCMNPENTLDLLRTDVRQKAFQLKSTLDDVRDLPGERDCLKLQEKCWDLELDSHLLPDACHTLRTRCHLKDLSEELKLRLLDERDGTLKNETICTHKLETECPRWNRKRENPFSFPCALPKDSCKLMTWRVEGHCGALEVNIKSQNVENKVDKENDLLEQEKTCMKWMTHCYNLMPNCDKLAENDNAPCVKLNKTCDPIIERWNNEGWLMYQLRGNLTNGKCKDNLDRFCMNWTKSENGTLSSFCKDKSNDNHDTYRTNLCDKLKKRIKEKCPVLKVKLEETKNEIKKKAKEYEKQRKEAQEAITNAKLNVTEQLQQKVKKASLVRRDAKSSGAAAPASGSSRKSVKVEVKSTPMTKQHAEAIELLSRTLDFYFELKEECDKLTLDCDFKEDCDGCKPHCISILDTCSKLQPLTIAEPRIIEGECKPETEKESKSPSEGKEGGKTSKPDKPAPGGAEGKGIKDCTSIKTSDTWVTSTSTHTTTTTSTKTTTLKVTLTSTRKCKPTKCTTGKGEPTSKGDEEEVVPSGGKRWLPSVGIAIVGVMVAIM